MSGYRGAMGAIPGYALASLLYGAGRYGYKKYRGYRTGRSRQAAYGRQAAYRARWGTKTRRGYGRRKGYYGRYNRPGAELKFHDITVVDGVVANGGEIQTALLQVNQGISESQRIGRKVVIRKIQMRFRLCLPSSTNEASTTDTCRIMIIQDTQTNGAMPVVLDVLETADIFSWNNLSNKGRFRTLCDKTIGLTGGISGNGTTTRTGATEYVGTWYKKCNIPIEYDNSASSGVITSIRSNNIFMLLCSSDNLIGFVCDLRFRFSDQ